MPNAWPRNAPRPGSGSAIMDALKQKAADYETILLEGGFIEPRPEEQGGNGENFVLTPRGSACSA